MIADEAELAVLRARAKTEIRRQQRSVRGVLPAAACAERSARACARLLALPELPGAEVVVGYAAFRKELDPGELLRHARALGKRIGLPRMLEDGSLSLHEYDGHGELTDNGYGIFEPSAHAPRIDPAAVGFIVVPALAIDPRGHRVGYGRGCYDRLLPTLSHAFKVGVIYDFQLIAEAPNDAHDVPLDCVVTDTRVLRPGS
jgi:5-formyltetrahydrofolate cyclo-ligase